MKRKWEKETSVLLRGEVRKVRGGGGGGGGELPHLVILVEIGSIRLGEKREREKTKEKRNGGRKGKKRKKVHFPAFRQSKLDGLSIKVDPRIASYVWVPKSWSFVKLHEVWNFPTWIIFTLKAI